MTLSPKLLDFASRLRALAVDGVFVAQGSARELASSLGVPERTMRERIKALEAHGALTRGNDRGGRISLDFRSPEERQLSTENGKNGNCRPDENGKNGKNGNGGGKGEAKSTQTKSHEENAAAAAAQTEPRTATRTASLSRTVTKNGKRTASLRKGHVRITLEGPPEDLAPIVEALRGVAPRFSRNNESVRSEAQCLSGSGSSSGGPLASDAATSRSSIASPGPAAPIPTGGSAESAATNSTTPSPTGSTEPSEPSASAPTQSSKASSAKSESAAHELSAEGLEALEFRVEQQRPIGFKKGESAFRRFMRRKLLANPHEIRELLDEKREAEEARGREPAPPPKPAPAIPARDTRLDELRKQIDAEKAKKAAQKILENSAARRGVAT